MTNPDLIFLLFCGLCGLQIISFFGGLLSILAAVRVRHQAQKRAWQKLAAQTGLTCESSGLWGLQLCVTGTYRGRSLTLDTFTRGGGADSAPTSYTRIVIFVNNQSHFYLALYEESVFSKIGKLFGAQDIQIGDEEIDRRFMIKGQPESVIVSLIATSGLRQKLLEARSLNLEMDGRELYFEEQGVEMDVNYLRFLFDLLSDMAEAIERAGGIMPASPVVPASDWLSSVTTGG
jgi:hypothetical protein